MKSEYKRIVTQASEEMLARWILKNLDWTGGNDDNNGAFLTSILIEHRRQCSSGPVSEGRPSLSESKRSEPSAYLFNGHAFTPNLLTSDQRARAVPLYALPSASGAVEALRECRAYFERELADDQTLIDGDFGKAYRLTVAALAATESRSKE
jgi:hypothetical protein